MGTGYDAHFLGSLLGLPAVPVSPKPAGLAEPLEYTHFTVQMHPARRLAWWVAWNVDGLTLFPGDSISRAGEDFKIDTRLPPEKQIGDAAYAGNDLDRGHIARRSDLLWGAGLAEARAANSDSFNFTNITPQRSGFNQSGRGGVRGLLENAVLALEGLKDRRLSVFAGPVLAEDDPPYRALVQLPREHWKVVVYRVDGALRCKAFLLTQSLDGIEPAIPDGFLDEFDTYLVPLDLLEERTGLEFVSLRAVASAAELRPAVPILVDDPERVPW